MNPTRVAAAPGVPLTLGLTTLLASMSSSIANVGLPALAAAFHASFTQMQWVVVTYLLAVTAAVPAMGWLGDRFGRQRLLAAGLLLFSAASFGCGAAGSIGWLLAARLLQGVGGAIVLVNSLALVAQAAPPARSGRAMGMMGTLSALGTAAGPALGGALVAGFGWRALFWVNLLPGLLLWASIRFRLPSLDVPQACAPRGGLATLLRQRALNNGLLLSLVVAAVMMTTLMVGPFYLGGALRLAPHAIGLLMAMGPLTSAAAGLPAGRLVDRIGSARATLAGLLMLAVGCALLSVLPQRLGAGGYAGGLITLTAGYALFQAANNTALLKGADPARRGIISGLLNFSRNLGFIVGAGLMAAVYAAAGDGLPPVAAAERGLSVTFALAGAMVLLALAAARPWSEGRQGIK